MQVAMLYTLAHHFKEAGLPHETDRQTRADTCGSSNAKVNQTPAPACTHLPCRSINAFSISLGIRPRWYVTAMRQKSKCMHVNSKTRPARPQCWTWQYHVQSAHLLCNMNNRFSGFKSRCTTFAACTISRHDAMSCNSCRVAGKVCLAPAHLQAQLLVIAQVAGQRS
jgi:hypothetical protein